MGKFQKRDGVSITARLGELLIQIGYHYGRKSFYVDAEDKQSRVLWLDRTTPKSALNALNVWLSFKGYDYCVCAKDLLDNLLNVHEENLRRLEKTTPYKGEINV